MTEKLVKQISRLQDDDVNLIDELLNHPNGLLLCIEKIKKVHSSNFSELSGKELGNAILEKQNEILIDFVTYYKKLKHDYLTST